MKNTMKAIAALLISATMISITACGNTDNTSSAAPKATTTASSTEASATTTEATLTSQSEETTSLSATTTGTSASTRSTSSSKSSTDPKNTAKTNSSKASNGGTVNNNQSYSHSTSNNGSGNNSYSSDNNNNNSYQPQQTERQTERQTQRQTTTTAKKTQAPKPKPTTTTAKPKPKFELTQNDIDRLKSELQPYSNDIARPIFKDIYAECGYSSVDELLADIDWMNLDNSSWGTPYTVSPDTYSSYSELYGIVKGGIKDLYTVVKDAQIVIYTEWHGDGSAINSGGKPAWEIYLIY